ncbi:MAG TPA: MvaI/BcnI family restriction endonuclease, partial [Acidimicrobiales bacterium]|nr:MvaI/BcnI family restriction endonuclease [Acidimicrobiales bacterium]
YVLVKPLALHQDNEKNQIYLGTSDSLMGLFPGTQRFRTPSESRSKGHSRPGANKIEKMVPFSWIHPGDRLVAAPHTRVIYYLQYPELRLSGFLKDSEGPESLRRDELDRYGRRVLVLGVRSTDVVGMVITDADGPGLVDDLSGLPHLPGSSLLRTLTLPQSTTAIDPTRLLAELRELSGSLHDAVRLARPGQLPKFQRANQGGGWTLEALLGIPNNGVSAPDKYGFELKSFSTNRVTVITTEPDFGYRHDYGVAEFLKVFGWPSKSDASKRVFNGPYYCNTELRGNTFTIDHWDFENNAPDGSGEPTVLLVNIDTATVIEGWSFDHLSAHWNLKHAGALYVETSGQRMDPGRYPSHYMFGPVAYLGLGTSILHLLRAVGSRVVHLDPGDSLNSLGKVHPRTQWRVAGNRAAPLSNQLAHLYDEFQVIDLASQ